MKYTSTLLIAFALTVLSVSAQTTSWKIDKSHSSIQFSVAHMVISETTGQFKSYEGTILSDAADFSDAKIDFSIDVNSIDTEDEKRDGHLKGEDFFHVASFPTITFKSTSMKKVGDNKYELTGDLTMHGVTKSITLDAKYGGTINDPWGNTKAGFKITGSLNRTAFGLEYNKVMEAGGLMIGEDIEIVCKVELAKVKAAANN